MKNERISDQCSNVKHCHQVVQPLQGLIGAAAKTRGVLVCLHREIQAFYHGSCSYNAFNTAEGGIFEATVKCDKCKSNMSEVG